MTISDLSLKPGTLLNDRTYKIIRYIANGGFGFTYEAVNQSLNQKKAIKEFFPTSFCNRDPHSSYVSVGVQNNKATVEKLKGKFIEEAKTIANFEHPGIVNVTDVFEENGTAYYVMDYIEGASLENIIRQKGPLSERETLHYILQVCEALNLVHSQNRLHLDIKPGNIMIDHSGRAVLIDFGASKLYDEDSGENSSSLYGKTPGYAPIEQMNGKVNHFYPATDIYSIGATMYKCLTGLTPAQPIQRTSGQQLAPLPNDVSQSTRNAIEKALELKSADRPQTINEFLSLLGQSSQSANNGFGGFIPNTPFPFSTTNTPNTTGSPFTPQNGNGNYRGNGSSGFSNNSSSNQDEELEVEVFFPSQMPGAEDFQKQNPRQGTQVPVDQGWGNGFGNGNDYGNDNNPYSNNGSVSGNGNSPYSNYGSGNNSSEDSLLDNIEPSQLPFGSGNKQGQQGQDNSNSPFIPYTPYGSGGNGANGGSSLPTSGGNGGNGGNGAGTTPLGKSTGDKDSNHSTGGKSKEKSPIWGILIGILVIGVIGWIIFSDSKSKDSKSGDTQQESGVSGKTNEGKVDTTPYWIVTAPESVVVGEEFEVTYAFSVPKGLFFRTYPNGNFTKISGPEVTNGEKGKEYTYVYKAEKVGVYAIPQASLHFDDEEILSKEYKIKVLKTKTENQSEQSTEDKLTPSETKPRQEESPGQNATKPMEPKEPKDQPKPTNIPITVSGTINGHEYVDLGLPSGAKWGVCNVGAFKVEEYGSYYAWGELKAKSPSGHCETDGKTSQQLYNEGYVDDNGNLTLAHDVAHHRWGGSWRMPTQSEVKELLNNTTSEWVTFKGIPGRLVKSKHNGNTMFLPAAGYYSGKSIIGAETTGYFWSSTLDMNNDSNKAYAGSFYSGYLSSGWQFINLGYSVRPVSN